MDQVLQRDVLLAYPFESMKPFLRLLREAANDPHVVSIKMTLYRVAKYSKVVEALIEAAENGKEVVVLVEASKAGVKVELIVRGICCLIAGVKGETENITIISIVGRYLEHSRIYCFGTEERRKVYLLSADFMTRNTCRRVEVAVPV